MASSGTGIQSVQDLESHAWQRSMQNAVRSVPELLECLALRPEDFPGPVDLENPFPLFVPREFIARMNPGDPLDPLLLQILPTSEERIQTPGYQRDPVGDEYVERAPGLLHKYTSRVLMIASGLCAVHCRYCFRRHFPYDESPKSNEQWQRAIDLIASDPSIREVILSGGDPLSLGNQRLKGLGNTIESIEHVQRLRIHTRFPVMIPNRIDSEFCDWIASSRLSCWVVLHINHANEIDQALTRAIRALKLAGASVLNQAVLLRGINDTVVLQRNLCERLIDVGVQPYYLHQLDHVEGAAHFETPLVVGEQIIDELRKLLPGYAVPRLVREVSGEPHKTLLR
ncbi:MAG: EF-P beta-lysylation protein EpmB [Planctomycetes bacterium]|nr:EF-P beta-lysylation protein EpmB [Planctomycetota bacterium]